ncbi:MAG: PspA/IM30 family protein [Candidatus Cloacimonetes bacterium]|nr:PspA/IM30 family protein [Candidatus Cloacimonadota bacterium]
MSLWQRIKRIFSSNLNSMLDSAENPEKMLDQVIRDMSDQLKNTKKHVASAIANQKKLERDYKSEKNKSDNYLAKAKAILGDDDESNDHLAKEALQKKKHHEQIANQIKGALDQQVQMVSKLKANLQRLEAKVKESEGKKNFLKAKHSTAKTQKAIAEQMAGIDTSSHFEIFDKLENKINEIEDTAMAQIELNAESMDNKLEDVTFDVGVESEFLELKKEASGLLEDHSASEAAPKATPKVSNEAVDEEFEKLKNELNS